jgi:hypothetical protein
MVNSGEDCGGVSGAKGEAAEVFHTLQYVRTRCARDSCSLR